MVVEFKMDAIDLRPDNELLAFKQTKQMMTLELLSLGLITDDEACLELTGKLPPAGYVPLAGTMFKGNANMKAETPDSPSNDGSTLNQNLNSDQPDTARGQNKKAESSDDSEDASAGAVEVQAEMPTFITPNITLNVDNTKSQNSTLKMRRDDEGNLVIERAEQ